MKRYIKASEYSVPVITTVSELIDTMMVHDYNYYGLRGAYPEDMNDISRGYLDCSSVWEDGDYFDEKLNGTCAVGINEDLSESELIRRYNTALNVYSRTGDVLLIADYNETYGDDENEVILGNHGYGADVVAIVRL